MIYEPWRVPITDGTFEVRTKSGTLVATTPTAAAAQTLTAFPDLIRASQKALAAVKEYEKFLPPAAATALSEMKAALAKAKAGAALP